MSRPPPTPDGVSRLGNRLAFARAPVAAMEAWATVGDVVHLEIPGRSMYMVTDPALIERVLVPDQDHAVTTNTGERWRWFSVGSPCRSPSTGRSPSRRQSSCARNGR